MSGERFALQQPEGIFDGINERPVELEQMRPGAPRQNDACHRSAAGSALGELAAKVLERDGLVPGELGQARFEGDQGVGVGQDLRSLLECLVLVDRDQRRSRSTVAGHKNVIAAIGDVAEQLA